MDILYIDLDQHNLEERLLMVRQLERMYNEDKPLLVIPKDCRFVEDASYSDLMEIKLMVDKALEEKEKDDLSSK